MELLCLAALQDTPYEEQVFALLCAHDHEFIPPLSGRGSTTQGSLQNVENDPHGKPVTYFEGMKQQPVILAVEDGFVGGFMAYKRGYTCKELNFAECIYASTCIVDEKMRGRGLMKQFYGELIKEAEHAGVVVATRTWSTNYAHLSILSKLGFKQVFCIPNGRGQGVDTVYYRREKTETR